MYWWAMSLIYDLQEVSQRWKREGDSIVMLRDWNNDVRCEKIADQKEQLGLHDVMVKN